MSKKKKPTKRNAKAVEVSMPENEKEQEKFLAQTYLRPTVLAAATIKGQYPNEDQININALIEELGKQVSNVHEGNLGRAEAMLITQAHTLDALFAELAMRSRMNMGEYMHAAEKYMRLALKAQSQCRTTLETLAEIKNPKPYIQNNKAQYQQVNNGSVASNGDNNRANTRTRARAGKKLKSTNGLLEDKTNEQQWLDAGTPETASGDDKELETVGEKHRP